MFHAPIKRGLVEFERVYTETTSRPYLGVDAEKAFCPNTRMCS